MWTASTVRILELVLIGFGDLSMLYRFFRDNDWRHSCRLLSSFLGGVSFSMPMRISNRSIFIARMEQWMNIQAQGDK